ncbi:hypothetical protein SERLA73DRAFT_75089 [Serpula lacrymans var. lacrymans S7.3]|uniref:Uncharacterized protein n=2 Tax=Serpula lacrymans var. lacrymans TaxID=341189 RepID=F8Q2J0_SERL3|nr:uncharacterized protein SERLADRAFT_439755 [Serpula lacrymans var. lacrymans S7.9]EGN97401.1 hypothetical protein SERLA73DRAFT_75089 [Serpula lacrymans var. lacrymans S7.3]EGO22991.1 hypothetical protein SERLADRAFT_439755 [Serpula lacrymans var. lacrymans S7.9]
MGQILDGDARKELIRASSAAQCGEDLLPTQHLDAPSTSYQLFFMMASTNSPQHQVTIRVVLHHLKVEGKSGTELVGNIERDISVPLSITACQLRLTIIDNLQLLWSDWLVGYDLSLESLEMHKAPKLLIYDPHLPFNSTEKLVLHNFFFHISGKDPTPRFAPNLKVSIILVMTNAQFEDILSWKSECKRGPGAHGQQVSDGADTDLEEAEQSGVYDPMDEVFRAATTFGQKRCIAQACGGSSARGESSSNSSSQSRSSSIPLSGS